MSKQEQSSEYLPPEKVIYWAIDNADNDTMADALNGIMYAIGSIDEGAVTESNLVSEKIEDDDESLDESMFDAVGSVDSLFYELIRVRNKLSKFIEEVMDL